MSKKTAKKDGRVQHCGGSGSHPTHKRSMTVVGDGTGAANCNVCGDRITTG